MNDVGTTVDTYFAMWNETDPAQRARHIEEAWAEDGRYLDPVLEAEGHGALSEMVAAVHSQFPDHRFRRTSGIDSHHDELRFAWELRAPDGRVAAAGIDVGALAPDGRLSAIVGFLGELPAAEAA
jgi:hypothetical protein